MSCRRTLTHSTAELTSFTTTASHGVALLALGGAVILALLGGLAAVVPVLAEATLAGADLAVHVPARDAGVLDATPVGALEVAGAHLAVVANHALLRLRGRGRELALERFLVALVEQLIAFLNVAAADAEFFGSLLSLNIFYAGRKIRVLAVGTVLTLLVRKV